MCDIFYLEYTVAKNICVISGISFLIRIIFVQYNLLSFIVRSKVRST